MTMPNFEPVAYMQLSVEEGVDTCFPRLHKPEKYNKDWWRFDPLHSADQLTEAFEAGKRDAGIDVGYPRDIFNCLIIGNSPYAFYLFQWVPYQTEAKRWRLKMLHDVRTFDGREAFGIWPNGSSCGPFKDDEVEFIRISKKQFGSTWEDPRPAAPKGEE